jgi:hypothetical protein
MILAIFRCSLVNLPRYAPFRPFCEVAIYLQTQKCIARSASVQKNIFCEKTRGFCEGFMDIIFSGEGLFDHGSASVPLL